MTTESIFIEAATKKLQHSTDRIVICIGKLTPDQIWARGRENENAVGNLVLHLCGNVRQWIIANLGGQPDVRVRDREFSATGDIAPEELIAGLRQTVAEATAVISGMNTDQLTQTHVIQGITVTGLGAVFHVINHFCEHTGQIIFATKSLTGHDLGLWAPKSAGSRPTTA